MRLPAADRYARQVAKEHLWLPELAPQLPLAIPRPVAQGHPAFDYPHPWSIYRWIDGIPATHATTNWASIAGALAGFLAALQRADSSGGPEPGAHNFFRGAPLSVYAEQTATAIDTLGTEVDPAVATVWDTAVSTRWHAEPVWVHGDVAPANLLTRNGALTAVIDFGTLGIGDPACDTVIAWTHLDATSRATFRRTLGVERDTWARGRGWALWKALVTLADQLDRNDDEGASTSRANIAATITDAADDP